MISWDELERLEQERGERDHYSIYISVALSLVLSLAAVAIISKNPATNDLWVDAAVFLLPIPIALYFRKRIVLLGEFSLAAALILTLAAAVLFAI